MLELTNADWSLGGRPAVRSMHGLVAAAHPLAANAGAEMLRRGGNAFDSAAATAAALNVVEPFMSGLAGAGAATYFNASTGEVSCLDFIPPLLPASIHLRWTARWPRQARSLPARPATWLAGTDFKAATANFHLRMCCSQR